MDNIKRVHKQLYKTRVVSIVGRFGFYVQVKPLPDSPVDVAWQTVAQWDYLSNAKMAAEYISHGLSGGFVSDARPIKK